MKTKNSIGILSASAIFLGALAVAGPDSAAPQAASITKDSVIVVRGDLKTGEKKIYLLSTTDLLNADGSLKVTPDKVDALVVAGKQLSEKDLQAWKNDHEADNAGIQASITDSNGLTVPMKNLSQVADEVSKSHPDGQLAKDLNKWRTEHESDLNSGRQAWFWWGFLAGGLTFAALDYLFTPQYYYWAPSANYGAYVVPNSYYYGVYAPWGYGLGYYGYGNWGYGGWDRGWGRGWGRGEGFRSGGFRR